MNNERSNKTRTHRIEFILSDTEYEMLQDRMRRCNITNMSKYLRLMAINGCIIVPDYTAIKERNYELNKIGVNINQIAKKVNETGQISASEINTLKELMDEIWQSQRFILSDEP